MKVLEAWPPKKQDKKLLLQHVELLERRKITPSREPRRYPKLNQSK